MLFKKKTQNKPKTPPQKKPPKNTHTNKCTEVSQQQYFSTIVYIFELGSRLSKTEEHDHALPTFYACTSSFLFSVLYFAVDLEVTEPFIIRGFFCGERRFSYPYTDSTVPNSLIYGTGTLPLIFVSSRDRV